MQPDIVSTCLRSNVQQRLDDLQASLQLPRWSRGARVETHGTITNDDLDARCTADRRLQLEAPPRERSSPGGRVARRCSSIPAAVYHDRSRGKVFLTRAAARTRRA